MPDFRDINPYQQLLADAAEEAGAAVTFAVGYLRGLPIYRQVQAHAPDVLHLHWVNAYLRSRWGPLHLTYAVKVLADLALVRQRGVGLVWTVHNGLSHEARHAGTERWLRRRLAALADRLIVHSEAARMYVLEHLQADPAKVAVIPHGHYRTVYGPAPERAAARRALGLPARGRAYLHLGLLRPYKGIEELLEVWGIHQASHPGDTLLIAGRPLSDQYGAALAAQAAEVEGVIFRPGFVPDEDLPLYFGAADVAVLPFREVMTSGSLILSLSYGTPVIAPRLGGLPEAVADADTLLYDPADSAGLLSALAKSATVDLGALLGRTVAACDRLEWDRIGTRTVDVYRDAAEKPSAARLLAALPA